MAANTDDPNSMFKLGICYKNSIGDEKNSLISIQYFEKAAQLLNSDAINCLASCYKRGEGVEKIDQNQLNSFKSQQS
jgi:TPR repeat protein